MRKRITSILSVVLVALLMVGCASKSPSELIVGKWEVKEGDNFFGPLEFSEDGKYTSARSTYTNRGYSIEDDQIEIEDIFGGTTDFVFELEEDVLTLYSDEGEVLWVYEKVE